MKNNSLLITITSIFLFFSSNSLANPTADLLKALESTNTKPFQVKQLIQAGAGIKAKNKYGWTALMLATKYHKNPQLVMPILLKTGANQSDITLTLKQEALDNILDGKNYYVLTEKIKKRYDYINDHF